MMEEVILPHEFESIWSPPGPIAQGRREVALVCRNCQMRVEDPRWSRRPDGKDVCYTLAQYPATCGEYAVRYVHES